MKSHFLKENDVVLSSRWQFEDGRSKGMGTEWDQEVVCLEFRTRTPLSLQKGRKWEIFLSEKEANFRDMVPILSRKKKKTFIDNAE